MIGTIVASATNKLAELAIIKGLKVSGSYLFGKYLDKRNLNSFLKQYDRYCLSILYARTLSSPEVAQFIDDIYYPIRISEAGSSIDFIVQDTTKLTQEKSLLIKPKSRYRIESS